MKLNFKSLKHLAKEYLPSSFYQPLVKIKKKLLLLPITKLYNIDKKLPDSYCVQRIRSLDLYGVSDYVLESAIRDYREFNLKYYGPVVDSVRIPSLIEAVLASNNLVGDIAECGVYHGSSAKIIRHFASPAKKLYLFDTFTGFTTDDRKAEMKKGLKRDPGEGHINTTLEQARSRIFSKIKGKESQIEKDSVVFCVGSVQQTLESIRDIQLSLVHLDMDLYAPTKFALDFFIPRIVKNGILLLHDYAVDNSGYRGVYQATMELDMTTLFGPLPFGDKATVLFIKTI